MVDGFGSYAVDVELGNAVVAALKQVYYLERLADEIRAMKEDD